MKAQTSVFVLFLATFAAAGCDRMDLTGGVVAKPAVIAMICPERGCGKPEAPERPRFVAPAMMQAPSLGDRGVDPSAQIPMTITAPRIMAPQALPAPGATGVEEIERIARERIQRLRARRTSAQSGS